MTQKIPCKLCQALILPATAEHTNGVCMACKQGVRRQIDESKRQYQLKKSQSVINPWEQLGRRLSDQIFKTEVGYSGLSDEEKLYVCICDFIGEITNGGTHQFFHNSSGGYFDDVVHGLKLLDEPQACERLIKAAQMLFPNCRVPSDIYERQSLLSRRSADLFGAEPKWSVLFREFDHEFWKETDRIGKKLETFAIHQGLVNGISD